MHRVCVTCAGDLTCSRQDQDLPAGALQGHATPQPAVQQNHLRLRCVCGEAGSPTRLNGLPAASTGCSKHQHTWQWYEGAVDFECAGQSSRRHRTAVVLSRTNDSRVVGLPHASGGEPPFWLTRKGFAVQWSGSSESGVRSVLEALKEWHRQYSKSTDRYICLSYTIARASAAASAAGVAARATANMATSQTVQATASRASIWLSQSA